eukprot:2914116-Rhodomonas_salina.2
MDTCCQLLHSEIGDAEGWYHNMAAKLKNRLLVAGAKMRHWLERAGGERAGKTDDDDDLERQPSSSEFKALQRQLVLTRRFFGAELKFIALELATSNFTLTPK